MGRRLDARIERLRRRRGRRRRRRRAERRRTAQRIPGRARRRRDSPFVLARERLAAASEPKLVATIPGASGEFFGFPLAFDGTTINANGDLLVADGGAWKSAGDFPLKIEGFPYTAVAVSGDTAIVAASGYYGGGGQALFVSRASGAWKKQQTVTEPDNDAFAAAVAVSGDTAIIGASATTNDLQTPVDELGAHVFKQHGGTWTEVTKLESGTGTSDGFGAALAIEGDTLVVGAPHTNVGKNSHQGCGPTPST